MTAAQQSETPRTDAAWQAYKHREFSDIAMCVHELARTLERELAAQSARLEAVERERDEFRTIAGNRGMALDVRAATIDDLRARLAKAEGEKKEMEQALADFEAGVPSLSESERSSAASAATLLLNFFQVGAGGLYSMTSDLIDRCRKAEAAAGCGAERHGALGLAGDAGNDRNSA